MTAGRFDKGKEECPIGPGSYDLPSTLDEHGLRISGTDRFNENGVEGDTPGPGFYDDEEKTEKAGEKTKVLTRTPSKGKRTGLQASTKENRGAMTPRGQDPVKKKLAMGVSAEARELEQLKKQLTNEERLRITAEAKVADLTAAKKWATEAQVQLQSKDRKLEDAQKKMEELNAQHRETQSKLRNLEADEGGRRKALHEKDQATSTLQKSLEQQKC